MRHFLLFLALLGLAACDQPLESTSSQSSLIPTAKPVVGRATPEAARIGGELQTKAAEFKKAIERGNWKTVIDIVPPRIINHIAEEAGISASELRKEMVSSIKDVMETTDAKFHNLEFEFEGVEIKKANTTLDGKKQDVLWAFVPNTGEASFALPNGKRLTQTLDEVIWAVKDKGVWYMVRSSDAMQVSMVKKLYPFMKNVRFPK